MAKAQPPEPHDELPGGQTGIPAAAAVAVRHPNKATATIKAMFLAGGPLRGGLIVANGCPK